MPISKASSNAVAPAAKGDLVVGTTTNDSGILGVGSNGETLVADSSASTGLRWQGNFAAGKNKIINGDFGIWQRGTSITPASGYGYTADRFITYSYGSSTTTVSRQTFTPGAAPVAGYEGQFFARINSTNTQVYFAQFIEDVRTFAGQTVTFSFYAKAGTAGTLTLNMVQQFGSGGSSLVSSTVNRSITTSWARYEWTVSVPSISGKTIGTNSHLDFEFVFGINNNLDLWGVQVEAGSVATAFQTATGTLAGELAACQRYFANVVPSTADYGTVISMFQATSGSTAKGGIRFPVPMRTSASITLASASNFTLANASYTPIGGSSFTYAIGNTVDCRIDMSVASGLVAGNATALSGNTANLLIQASAEL